MLNTIFPGVSFSDKKVLDAASAAELTHDDLARLLRHIRSVIAIKLSSLGGEAHALKNLVYSATHLAPQTCDLRSSDRRVVTARAKHQIKKPTPAEVDLYEHILDVVEFWLGDVPTERYENRGYPGLGIKQTTIDIPRKRKFIAPEHLLSATWAKDGPTRPKNFEMGCGKLFRVYLTRRNRVAKGIYSFDAVQREMNPNPLYNGTAARTIHLLRTFYCAILEGTSAQKGRSYLVIDKQLKFAFEKEFGGRPQSGLSGKVGSVLEQTIETRKHVP